MGHHTQIEQFDEPTFATFDLKKPSVISGESVNNHRGARIHTDWCGVNIPSVNKPGSGDTAILNLGHDPNYDTFFLRAFVMDGLSVPGDPEYPDVLLAQALSSDWDRYSHAAVTQVLDTALHIPSPDPEVVLYHTRRIYLPDEEFLNYMYFKTPGAMYDAKRHILSQTIGPISQDYLGMDPLNWYRHSGVYAYCLADYIDDRLRVLIIQSADVTVKANGERVSYDTNRGLDRFAHTANVGWKESYMGKRGQYGIVGNGFEPTDPVVLTCLSFPRRKTVNIQIWTDGLIESPNGFITNPANPTDDKTYLEISIVAR